MKKVSTKEYTQIYGRKRVCKMLNDLYACLCGKKTLRTADSDVNIDFLLVDDTCKAAVREFTGAYAGQAGFYRLPARSHGRALWARMVLSELSYPESMFDLVDCSVDAATAVLVGKKIRQNQLSPGLKNLRKVFGVGGVSAMLEYPYLPQP